MVKAKVNQEKLHGILKASYQNNHKAKKTLKKQGLKLDRKLSGKRAKVFTDSKGKPSIVYRGTQNIHDVGTDVGIAFGRKSKLSSKRLKHSRKVHDQTMKKYKTKKVNTYGHSLGGYLAENVGAKGHITTFNKASVGHKVTNKKQTDVRTKHDVVSKMTPKHKNLITLKGSKNPLKTHSTDMLK